MKEKRPAGPLRSHLRQPDAAPSMAMHPPFGIIHMTALPGRRAFAAATAMGKGIGDGHGKGKAERENEKTHKGQRENSWNKK